MPGDVRSNYAQPQAPSVRCRTQDAEIFEGQVRLWRAFHPNATAQEEGAAVERIRQELAA